MTGLEKSENGTEILQQINVYNGDGQRIRKSESGSALTQTETNRDYFYQDGTVLYTREANGQNDFNVIGSEGNITTSSRISGSNEEWFVYNRDIRGSVTSIYDSSEEIAAEYDYDEFGNTSILFEDGTENEFGYTGLIYDRNTGLYYYNARFYDSETGRFTSQDTYRGDWNAANTYHLYVYCSNNPVNCVDLSGHSTVQVIMLFGKTITKSAHYSRNVYNTNVPRNLGLTKANNKYTYYSYKNSLCHQFHASKKYPNQKYVSSDGHKEGVYKYKSVK